MDLGLNYRFSVELKFKVRKIIFLVFNLRGKFLLLYVEIKLELVD